MIEELVLLWNLLKLFVLDEDLTDYFLAIGRQNNLLSIRPKPRVIELANNKLDDWLKGYLISVFIVLYFLQDALVLLIKHLHPVFVLLLVFHHQLRLLEDFLLVVEKFFQLSVLFDRLATSEWSLGLRLLDLLVKLLGIVVIIMLRSLRRHAARDGSWWVGFPHLLLTLEVNGELLVANGQVKELFYFQHFLIWHRNLLQALYQLVINLINREFSL